MPSLSAGVGLCLVRGKLFINVDYFGDGCAKVGHFLSGGALLVFEPGAVLSRGFFRTIGALWFLFSDSVLKINIVVLPLCCIFLFPGDHLFDVDKQEPILLLKINNSSPGHNDGGPLDVFGLLLLHGPGGGKFIEVELELAGEVFEGFL